MQSFNKSILVFITSFLLCILGGFFRFDSLHSNGSNIVVLNHNTTAEILLKKKERNENDPIEISPSWNHLF